MSVSKAPCFFLLPAMVGVAAAKAFVHILGESSAHRDRNTESILASGSCHLLQTSFTINKVDALIPVWLPWLHHVGQHSEKKETGRTLEDPSSAFLILQSRCLSQYLFYLTSSQSTLAVLYSESVAHRLPAVHSSYPSCCFVITQRLLELLYFVQGSETTSQQASVSRGGRVMPLCSVTPAHCQGGNTRGAVKWHTAMLASRR